MSFVLPSTGSTYATAQLIANRGRRRIGRAVTATNIPTSEPAGEDDDRRCRLARSPARLPHWLCARPTAWCGRSIMKFLGVLILYFVVSGAARADEAAQCRANAGTFLTGSVTQGPTFTT